MTIERIAKVCHEVNKAYCESIGDKSQEEWDECEDWQRESAINGVLSHVKNPDAGVSNSHDWWMTEKLQAGWKFGAVKDAVKKEHPCIVPYGELPREQQAKDYIFRQIVHSLKGFICVGESMGKGGN